METAEIIGIAASVLVLVSFLFKNIRTIRIISIVGCIVFVVYGILIGALSIWLLNGALILVHIFFLIRMRLNKKKKSAPTPPKEPGARLDKFNNNTFNKKGLRNKPWVIDGDIS